MAAGTGDGQTTNGVLQQDNLRQPESEHTRSSPPAPVSWDGCSQDEWTVFVCPGKPVVTREVTHATRHWRPEVIWPTTPAVKAAGSASPPGELQHWATAPIAYATQQKGWRPCLASR